MLGSTWALLNLVLCFVGAVFAIAIMMAARLLTNTRGFSDDTSAADFAQLKAEEKQNRNRLLLFLAIPFLAIVSILIFIFTQDMMLEVVVADFWTPVHAVIIAAEVICSIFAFRKRKS